MSAAPRHRRPTPQEQMRRSEVARLERAVWKLERKAGPAKDSRDEVNAQLRQTIDVDLPQAESLEEVGRLGRRVVRYSEQLRAADQLPDLRALAEAKRAELGTSR